MSAPTETPWYRLGYALEAARRTPTPSKLRALGERLAAFREEGKSRVASGDDRDAPVRAPKDGGQVFDDLIAGGAAAVAVKMLKAWPARRRSGWSHVVRASLAGAGAALLRELTAPLLRGRLELPEIDDGLGGRLLSGAARGALYGSFVEPRLPGPPVVRGLIYGSAEYLAAPWGGLSGMLGSVAPWRRIPGLSSIVGDSEIGEDGWIDHLVFGMALALLAGVALDLAPLLDADDEDLALSDLIPSEDDGD